MKTIENIDFRLEVSTCFEVTMKTKDGEIRVMSRYSLDAAKDAANFRMDGKGDELISINKITVKKIV